MKYICAILLPGVCLLGCGGAGSSPESGGSSTTGAVSSSGTSSGSDSSSGSVNPTSGAATGSQVDSGTGSSSGATSGGGGTSGGSGSSGTGSGGSSGGSGGRGGGRGGRSGGRGGSSGGSGGSSGGGGDAGASHIKTVFLILMENHNWSDIHGSASAPYINNTLLPASSSCSNYFDNPKSAHPSEPNYLWLEAGDNFGILDDNDPATNHQATTSHLVTLLTNAGVTWKSYQEDITAGTCPIVAVKGYAPKHNPMVFFDDIAGNPPSATNATCAAHVRPYTELAGDLTGGKVAAYNFITPNLCDDMHDTCTGDAIKQGDDWLKVNIPVIQASAAYTNGGAIFITWDESEGGEVPIGMIVVSPLAKGNGYVGTTKYYHSSMLRSVQEIFGVTPLLRDAANQPDLKDLFTSFP